MHVALQLDAAALTRVLSPGLVFGNILQHLLDVPLGLLEPLGHPFERPVTILFEARLEHSVDEHTLVRPHEVVPLGRSAVDVCVLGGTVRVWGEHGAVQQAGTGQTHRTLLDHRCLPLDLPLFCL